MAEIIKFNKMAEGVQTETVLLVKGLEEKISSTNSTYVAMELSDGDKIERVNMFNTNLQAIKSMGLDENVIIIAQIKPNRRNGKLFYNIDSSNWSVYTDNIISIADFVRMAPIDIDEEFEKLIGIVKSVDSNPEGVGPYKTLSYLTIKMLENRKEEFKRSSAAIYFHHNFLGGLLFHSVRMAEMALETSRVYKQLDRELLVCGAALHDIGKLRGYITDAEGSSGYSVEGALLDHLVIGIMMIKEEAEKELYNPEKILLLEHMIAAHHGKLEYGAIAKPQIPEAQVLYLIDTIDARMNMFDQAYENQTPGTLSEKKVFGLDDAYIYKPMYRS